jgi:hypothetical protein
MTPQEQAAESAKYLNTDVTPTSVGGKPTLNFYEETSYGNGNIISASLTGSDGNPYFFVSRDYVNKGFVQEANPYMPATQFYNPQFLSPTAFDNAAQYKLDTGTQGFVWKQDDAKKLGIYDSNSGTIASKRGYAINGANPAIMGISYPVYTADAFKQNLSYVSTPEKISDQLVGQQFITADGTRYDGSFGYEYYLQGWLADRLRAGLPTVNALMPIVLEVLAPGTGAGSTYAAVSAATSATVNALTTGNLEQGVVDLAKIYAASQVGDLVSKGINWSIPVDTNAVAKTILGGAGTNAVIQGLYGKDVSKAFVDGGIQAGVNAVAGSISGFGDLPKPVQKVFNAAVTTNLQGKSGKQIDAATLQAAISAGLGAVANGIDANAKIQKEFGREATAEELNKFIWYADRNAFNKEFDTFVADTKGSQTSARQAEIDAQNKLDAESAAQIKAREETAAAQAKAQADAQAAIDAETARAAQEAKDAEEQAKRVADFGKNLTGGGGQNLGPVDTNTDFYDKDSSGMGAYKYDPTSGTYTYTSDDGSTLTLDGDGNITGVTEATDTSWAKLTDAKTGNIKLPKLPSGKTPVTPLTKPPVTPPAQPDPLSSILSQQETPVSYQTVMPELAKVFYGGKDFSSTPQKLNEQGQLVQKNPLLGGAKPQTASPLALQDGSEENDVTKLLSQVLGTEGDQNSQQDFMNYFGRA